MFKVLAFYKYTDLENPTSFAQEHLAFCNSVGLKGRILVANEGINGSVSGTQEQVDQYKQSLSADPRFSGIEFKEDPCLMLPFNKMNVKTKPELVRFEQSVDYRDAGTHLSPQEFLHIANNEDVVLLDARNTYESRVGKFKNAITPDIETFKDFPKVLSHLEGKQDKKILMYCTGGIRCEKASAFLKQSGFNQVYQLHGGILNFAKQCPDTIWEGKCFVFDKRLISPVNEKENPITQCDLCSIPCDLYKRCRNVECNKLAIVCLSCEKSVAGCCSQECYNYLFSNSTL